MKSLPSILLGALFLPCLAFAQNNAPNPQGSGTATPEGWRGFLSIDYKGGRLVMPYSRIVSLSRHEFLVDGGGKVHELTVDTAGQVTARYYYLESVLENNPLNSVQILNNRLKKTTTMAENRTGQDARSVVKHYPDTTHAKTVEFNASSIADLERIFRFVTRKWIDENGRGNAETLKFE